MAEEGRLELPHRVTPAYKFSKLAPSPTWVLLHMYGGELRCRSPYGSAPYHRFSRSGCPPGQLTLQIEGKTYNFTYNSGPSPYFNYYLHTYSVIGKTSLSFGSRLLTSCPKVGIPTPIPIADWLLLIFTHHSELISKASCYFLCPLICLGRPSWATYTL